MTVRARAALVLGAIFGAGCSGPVSTLDPAGPQAEEIAWLGWLMFVLSIAVMLLVVGLMAWALWRGRRPNEKGRSPIPPMALVISGGVLLPVAVIGLLWFLSLPMMAALAVPPRAPQVEVEVTGRQFTYQVDYPAADITLHDEIRIPVGDPVLVRLASADVIHSFWVPRLGGKMDLVPGTINETWLEASQPGTYEGRCAEFCGIGHTQMRLVVIAMPAAEFDAWLASGGMP